MNRSKQKKSCRKYNKKRGSCRKKSNSKSRYYGIIGDKCPIGSSVLDIGGRGYYYGIDTLTCYKNCGLSERTDGKTCKPIFGKNYERVVVPRPVDVPRTGLLST